MKIYKFKDFLRLPRGTIFCTYHRGLNFGNLSVKENTIYSNRNDQKEPIDFYYSEIYTEFEDCDIPLEFDDKIFLSIKNNKNDAPNLDTEVSSREGLFDENNLYLVYDREDIIKIMKVLEKSI